jgi:hypothetical protein
MRRIVGTALMLSLGSTGALAQNTTAASGWVPTLVVRPVPSHPEGARVSDVTGYLRLTKGESATATIWSGRALCSFGIAVPARGGEPSDVPGEFGLGSAATIWKITGDYLGEQNGRYQIRVRSGFTRIDGSESTAMVTQTLSLRDGDDVVLDALKEPGDAACPVRIATFEARLALQPTDPALARAQYTADMWLIHTDPEGKEQREHLVMNIDGSSVMPFMFNRLAFPIPQVDPRQGNTEAVIQLTGALRVRPLADGRVVLDLDANRLIYGLENPDRPLRSAPTPLRMTLGFKEGETMRVDFPPPPSGFSSIALTKDGTSTVWVKRNKTAVQTAPSGAIEVKEGKLVLWTYQFFRNHKTQLLITLRKLP